MEILQQNLVGLASEAAIIWESGGWAMMAIAVIALVMFMVGMNIRLGLDRKGFLKVSEKRWRHWMENPEERRGPIGKLLDEASKAHTVKQCGQIFDQINLREVAPFSKDLRVMKICVTASPLVGLLGTVTGMLSTFGALSGGSGGDQTMGMVAGGISEALITTETGLVIALPGLFFQYQLVRRHERYKAFIAHLETVCTQAIYRRHKQSKTLDARRVARNVIARRLKEKLPLLSGQNSETLSE